MKPDPKPPRKKLLRSSIAWRNLVTELYERDNHECQGCGKWLNRNEANPHHHPKTRGAGAGDTLEELTLLCSSCHVKIDSGELILDKEV